MSSPVPTRPEADEGQASMETLLEALDRLSATGYEQDFLPVDGGALRCRHCQREHPATDLHVDEIVRFEGNTDPSDEAILFALRCDCGQKGVFVAAFGPDASAADSQIIRDLR